MADNRARSNASSSIMPRGAAFAQAATSLSCANSALKDGKAGRQFFHDEYQLNHLLFTYPKPVVAFMDGICMGGGVGISQPAKFRVATENTRFAMPETGIGLFPDVGGGWYLSRLEGRVGQFLALTGARVAGAGCLALGLATHYLPSEATGRGKSADCNGGCRADRRDIGHAVGNAAAVQNCRDAVRDQPPFCLRPVRGYPCQPGSR